MAALAQNNVQSAVHVVNTGCLERPYHSHHCYPGQLMVEIAATVL